MRQGDTVAIQRLGGQRARRALVHEAREEVRRQRRPAAQRFAHAGPEVGVVRRVAVRVDLRGGGEAAAGLVEVGLGIGRLQVQVAELDQRLGRLPGGTVFLRQRQEQVGGVLDRLGRGRTDLVPGGHRVDQVGRLQQGLRGERAVGKILGELPEDADPLVPLPLLDGVDPLREGAGVERPVVVLLLRRDGRRGARGAEQDRERRGQDTGPGRSSQNFTVTSAFFPPVTATATSCSAPFGTNTTLTWCPPDAIGSSSTGVTST